MLCNMSSLTSKSTAKLKLQLFHWCILICFNKLIKFCLVEVFVMKLCVWGKNPDLPVVIFKVCLITVYLACSVLPSVIE